VTANRWKRSSARARFRSINEAALAVEFRGEP
jgi:hypothetical protein